MLFELNQLHCIKIRNHVQMSSLCKLGRRSYPAINNIILAYYCANFQTMKTLNQVLIGFLAIMMIGVLTTSCGEDDGTDVCSEADFEGTWVGQV